MYTKDLASASDELCLHRNFSSDGVEGGLRERLALALERAILESEHPNIKAYLHLVRQ